MKYRLCIVYLLNLFDMCMTMLWVKMFGPSIELNPLMDCLREFSLAVPIKIVGVGVALLALYWGIKRKPKYEWTSWLLLAFYAVLAVYHMAVVIAFIIN